MSDGPRLRHWLPEDADALFAATADEEIARQLPTFASVQDARAYIAKTAGDDARVAWALVEGTTVLGGVAAQLNRRMRTAWVSYWLVESARGRGLATRATVTLSQWLFAQENMHRLELAHRLNNPTSGLVAERSGFVLEGIMREELEYDGVRHDTALRSRLVSDPRPEVELLPSP